MLTDADLRAQLDRLRPFEDDVPWMYLDGAKTPNVTTGVGFLVFDVDTALALPWQHGVSGGPAAPDEIRAEFFRVLSMRGGLQASAYKGSLRLSPAAIEAEGFRRLRSMLKALPNVFPGFAGFPVPVQQALLDLAWNCGLGRYPGLMGWAKLRTACNSVPPDWLSAAEECRTANPNGAPTREARNAWRAQCFLTAEGLQG
jgi:hypothetical protein